MMFQILINLSSLGQTNERMNHPYRTWSLFGFLESIKKNKNKNIYIYKHLGWKLVLQWQSFESDSELVNEYYVILQNCTMGLKLKYQAGQHLFLVYKQTRNRNRESHQPGTTTDWLNERISKIFVQFWVQIRQKKNENFIPSVKCCWICK